MNIYFKILLIVSLISFSVKAEIVKKIEINGNQRVSSETIKIFSEVETNSDLNLQSSNITNFDTNIDS